MEKILAYTFRTFPYRKDLAFEELYVFGKLNEDIHRFCNVILTKKPNRILGFANSSQKYSTIEKYSINKFHRNKRVLNNTPEIYELNVPFELKKYFHVRTIPTKSFCNLSIFKIKHFLEENRLDIPFSFIHIVKTDLKYFNYYSRNNIL